MPTTRKKALRALSDLIIPTKFDHLIMLKEGFPTPLDGIIHLEKVTQINSKLFDYERNTCNDK